MGEALSQLEGPDAQAQDIGAAGSAQESVLLSELIQLLHKRERHSLLLSDLGALLPNVLRQRVKDQGGLRSWLQRYSSLFSVVGQPGKESVTLCLGAAMQHEQPGAFPVGMAAAVGPMASAASDDAEGYAAAANGAYENDEDREEDPDALSAVQLRGLPYRATLEDIVTFLGEHSSDLAESNAVQLVQNRDGRPSGFARIQFNSPESAKRCVGDLHLRSMEDRYVEVFLYSERPSKGRQRRGGHEDGTVVPGEQVRLAAALDASGVTREQVVRECRMQMGDVKKRKLLLSMLGVALSPGARSYLKQMDQGLKHFLTQFPNEFSVDGGKGCEYVHYSPTQLSLSQAIDGFDSCPSAEAMACATAAAYGRAAPRSCADELGPLPASPKAVSTHAQLAASPHPTGGPASANRGINTPSDWGTPAQWPGPAAPWAVPAWPQGVPGAAGSEASAWGQMPAWPMPPPQYGWPGGWPSYPFGMEGAPAPSASDAAAAAALGAAQGGIGGASVPSAQTAAAAAQAAAAAPLPQQHQQAGPAASTDALTTAVRLRGLPFTSVEQDVLAFFAQHDIVDRIADGPKAVNILTRSNGRPSGQAIVQMREPQDAELAQGVLHGQWMGSRYIEVFLMAPEENEAGSAPSTSMARPGQQEPISLAMGVPAPAAASASAPPQLHVPNGHPQDLGQFPGLAGGMPPPWQLGMWSAAMAGTLGAPPPLGPADFGGGGEASSWEALFEFLGPEGSAAAMAHGMPPPQMDFMSMGLGGPGFMHGMPTGNPPANDSGVPTANGAPAAAAV